MKISLIITLAVTLVYPVLAQELDVFHLSRRDLNLMRGQDHRLLKRCVKRKSKTSSASSTTAHSASASSAGTTRVVLAATSKSSSKSSSKTVSRAKSASQSKSSAKSTKSKTASSTKASSTSSAAKSTATLSSVGGISLASTSSGLWSLSSSTCGSSGATEEYPNGTEDFLNCGISKSDKTSGWTPPAGVTIDKIAYVSMEEALEKNSVWKPCKSYISLFEKYGEKYGLPPILLAALALQESTCNKDESGDNGGAVGLMQITTDKCGGRSKSDCADPDYNIKTAAAYFKSQLDAYDGNFLLALGQYNGWVKGMSYKSATAAASTGCCECQNNLDYLYQMLGGWLLGRTGYDLGTYQNLDSC